MNDIIKGLIEILNENGIFDNSFCGVCGISAPLSPNTGKPIGELVHADDCVIGKAIAATE